MGTALMISALDNENGRAQPGTTTDSVNEKNALIMKIRGVLEAHDAAAETIQKDQARSEQGKAEAIKRIGTEQTAPALKFLRRVIEALEAKDEGYRKRFFSIDSGITDIVERMAVFTYLWGRLDTLDPSARMTQFAQAAEQDQVRVLVSMLEHPLVDTLVSEDVRERVLTERAKRLFPKPYANFEQTQIVLGFLTMIRNWIGTWLLEIGVPLEAIRSALGDEIANALTPQTRTGIPQPEDSQPQLTGALQ